MNDPETPDPTTNRQTPGEVPIVSDSVANGQEPKWIGEYQLICRIGGGGMGVVYEALHRRLKRRVALKLISESYLSRGGASRRFFREMEAAGRLEHPHIVRATDAGVVDGTAYLVMEFVQGWNLAQVVRQCGAMPPLAALEAIEQAAKALGHIHAHGMVHRDIKPSNLMLSDRGQVKVADLGLAHLLDPESKNDEPTTTGLFVGTVDYMAPEQARDPKAIDHRADIYSLGCCMYFLFAGAPVFRAEAPLDRLIAHRTESVPELIAACGLPIPKALNRLFQQMLAKEPDGRPQSIGEVLSKLQVCRDDLRQALARAVASPTSQLGGQSLPIDAELEDTVRNLSITGLASEEVDPLKTTVLIRKSPKRSHRWLLLVGGILAIALTVFLTREHWLPLLVKEKQSTVVEQGRGSSNESRPADSATASPKPFVFDAHPRAAVFNVHFSEDGQQILSCGSDGIVRVWDVASKKRIGEMRHERGPNGLHVIDVVLIPNSSLAVSVSYNGIATVWDWKKSQKRIQFQRHRNQVEGIAWIKGTRVLTTGRDDTIYIWDAMTGDVIAELPNSHTGGVRAVAVDGDGLRALTADYGGNVLLWSLEEGDEHLVDALQPINEAIEIWSVDWIPSSDQVAFGGVYASGEPLLVTYDVETRQIVRRFSHLTGRVYGVRASRDGRQLFSAADIVQGWSLEQGIDMPLFEFTDHNDNVFSVDQSPDGSWLVTGGTDGTVRVFRWREMESAGGAGVVP